MQRQQASFGVHTLPVPHVGPVDACLLPNPTGNSQTKFRLIFRKPIWHPAVDPQSNQAIGSYPDELFRQITDLEYACRDPFNIDASIDFQRDLDRFIKRNRQIQERFDTEECCMCLERLNDPTEVSIVICSNSHLVHHGCYDERIRECPLCREKAFYRL